MYLLICINNVHGEIEELNNFSKETLEEIKKGFHFESYLFDFCRSLFHNLQEWKRLNEKRFAAPLITQKSFESH